MELKKYWDDRQCACVCKTKCPIGIELDLDLCICKDMMSSCSISPLHFEGAHPAKIATYVGISAIGIVAVTILVSMYFMVSRKRPFSDLRTDSSSSSVAVVPQLTSHSSLLALGRNLQLHWVLMTKLDYKYLEYTVVPVLKNLNKIKKFDICNVLYFFIHKLFFSSHFL